MIDSPQLQSFLRHLDELRVRFIKCLLAFGLAAFACFYFAQPILVWLIKPAGRLVFTSPAGGFAAVMTVTMVMALLVSLPVILYQIWAFVAGALKPQERRFVFIFGPLSLLFFLSGVAFAFWVAVPTAYKFLMGFTSEDLVPMITVDNYLGFLGNMLVAFGVAFELPLILAFLAKIGIATPEFLRQKRRYAVLILLVLAAVLSPSPDVASQLLLAVPLWILYELGIVLMQVFHKRKTL